MQAFHAELDQGVVDIGDVGAVSDARDAARPRVGDPLGIEDERQRAVVEHLAGDAAQGHRLAAARGGMDQDVRRFRVQVHGPASRPHGMATRVFRSGEKAV
ncbi:hypothetical protein [Streptomyces sp. NPDC056821]|uniref:hypothetical protein n=1 Tax=unclassified Streptomyces TaxID=2593676 RepID=UPI00369970A7